MNKVFFALGAALAVVAGACATGSIDTTPEAGTDASSSTDGTTTSDVKASDSATNDATTCASPSVKCATDGGSVCVDVKADINHCGQCTTACASGDAGSLAPGANNPEGGIPFDSGAGWSLGSPTCDGGSCGTACGSMTECADGICYDMQSFHGHCGDCNTACTDTEWCNGGHCCTLNQLYCSGSCIDVLSDKNNCGGCGVVCPGGKPFCAQGVCTAACSPQGTRQAFNTLSSHTSSGCWSGNPCAQGTYTWSSTNGQSFINTNEDVVCGGTTACVDHIGITTYEVASNCQGSWDAYCDATKVGTIDTTNKACMGDAMTNGCSITLTSPLTCSTIRFVGVTGSAGACCGSTGLHSMITAVSAW